MDLRTHNLPNICQILVGATDAVIYYKNGLRPTRISAMDKQTLLELLSSFLVPVQYSSEFKTLQAYNSAVDGLEEQTQDIILEEMGR